MATNQSSSYLPQELVREVLARLPVKSLVKFKYVCKEWFTLIGDPEFAKSQLQLSPPARGVGNVYDLEKPGVFSYFNADTERGFESEVKFNVGEIVRDFSVIPRDSCNGLLLLERKFLRRERTRRYYVCNPITRWYLKLPLFLYDVAYHIYRASLSYDRLNQKYKVLIILKELKRDQRSQKCMVFTRGNNDGDGDGNSSRLSQWRELDIPVTSGELLNPSMHPINGGIYWMIERGPRRIPCILQMDLGSEEFSLIDSPSVHQSPPTIGCCYRLHQMKGSLCLAICVSYDQVDLWVLNDAAAAAAKQTWSKKSSIYCQPMIDAVKQARKQPWIKLFMSMGIRLLRDKQEEGDFCFAGRLYFITENPTPVITFLVCYNGVYVLYDLETGQVKLVKKNFRTGFGYPVPHVNSLIHF